MSLVLGGDHPGAAWLAVYLFHRGYPLQWKAPLNPIASQYLIMAYGLHHLVGEPIPNWPIEVCLQTIKGISHWFSESSDQDLKHILRPFQADVLSLPDCRFHFQQEISVLKIPEVDQESQARLEINISFLACQQSCPAYEYSGVLNDLSAPAGLLEMLSQSDSKLICTALSPQKTAFSYLASSEQDDNFWPSLQMLWPDHVFENRDLAWRSACMCWPQIAYSISERRLDIYVPLPSLQIQGLIQQNIAWLLIQFLSRRLGDEFHQLEAIPQELDYYLQKVVSVLPNLFKSYKTLGIHP